MFIQEVVTAVRTQILTCVLQSGQFLVKKCGKMIQIFRALIDWIQEDNNLVSKEGREILDDPKKRVKLREYISHYQKTGEWDTEIFKDGEERPTKSIN